MRRSGRNNEIRTPYLETALAEHPEIYGCLDAIAFGFPCQDISIANPKGVGLAGNRSGIFFECMRVVSLLMPKWIIIENVPRLLSKNKGRDMAVVIQTLAECGYGWSYRVLNSRYFGVPQGRKRLFIVGRFGTLCPPEILFQSEGDKGDVQADPGPSPKSKALSTRSKHDTSVETFIGHTIKRQHGVHSATDTNIVAKTLGTGGRGYNGFMWQENYFAEIDSDREREIAGFSRGLDTARGAVIGNAVTVPVARRIGEWIVDYENEQLKTKDKTS